MQGKKSNRRQEEGLLQSLQKYQNGQPDSTQYFNSFSSLISLRSLQIGLKYDTTTLIFTFFTEEC